MPIDHLDRYVNRSRKVLNASAPQTKNKVMSEQAIESDNIDDVGQTSAESSEESAKETKSLPGSFNIYNALLLVSLICISLAIVQLVVESQKFGPLFSFFWRPV
jgi:UDP-N-acetylmuramyl tripeptide synthase